MKKYGITLLVFVIALLPLGYWTYDYAYFKWFSPQLEVGDRMPAFVVEDLQENPVASTDLDGKVAVLVFFAHWCPSCLLELPHVEKELWQRYAKDSRVKIRVIGRAIPTDTLQAFVRKEGYTFPIYADPGRRAYRKFARKTIPRTYVIARDGRIVWSSTGYNPEAFQEMLRTVESNL